MSTHHGAAPIASHAASRGGALSALLLLAGVIGALLLIAADFSTLIEVRVITVVKDRITGGEQHSYALVLLGALAIPMALGAALGRSRPAAVALAIVGVIALLVALVGDLPDVDMTGLTKTFEAADARHRRAASISRPSGPSSWCSRRSPTCSSTALRALGPDAD